MNTCYNYVKRLEPHIRKISTNVASYQKSHYDSLGISSKATQADVKSAYYKLSMVYHPDKNKDSEEAAKKFRDITEAYEVLGNVKSRKLYDKGLYIKNTPVYEEPPMQKFYRSREMPTSNRATVYDFDEWSRAHYGATFQSTLRYKERQKFRQQRAKQMEEDVKSEKVILLVGLLFLLGTYLLVDKDYDKSSNVAVFGATDIIKTKSD